VNLICVGIACDALFPLAGGGVHIYIGVIDFTRREYNIYIYIYIYIFLALKTAPKTLQGPNIDRAYIGDIYRVYINVYRERYIYIYIYIFI
jgi:hypothetical protein